MADNAKALLAYADQVAEAAMRFSVECMRARYDLERMLNGEEPRGPVFVDRRTAVQDYHHGRAKR